MKESRIVQFNCFSTNVDHNAFISQWEKYAENAGVQSAVLLQQAGETKGKFRYISKQVWEAIITDQKPVRYFPEAFIKMLPGGGYIQLHSLQRRTNNAACVRILAFLAPNVTDIEPWLGSQLYQKLNVYQAYYESCKFSYVFDIQVPAIHAAELLQLLQNINGIETGIYKECLVPA